MAASLFARPAPFDDLDQCIGQLSRRLLCAHWRPKVEDERDSPESRWVLRGLLIMMAVAGLALGLVTLLGHGIVGG